MSKRHPLALIHERFLAFASIDLQVNELAWARSWKRELAVVPARFHGHPHEGQTMQRNRIELMIDWAHNPTLAEATHVNVLFDDGELVNTKGGQLLWRRPLQLREFGFPVSFGYFPVRFGNGKDTCAFVSDDDATKIRTAMKEEFPKLTGTELPSEQKLSLIHRLRWWLNVLADEKKATKREGLAHVIGDLMIELYLGEQVTGPVSRVPANIQGN